MVGFSFGAGATPASGGAAAAPAAGGGGFSFAATGSKPGFSFAGGAAVGAPAATSAKPAGGGFNFGGGGASAAGATATPAATTTGGFGGFGAASTSAKPAGTAGFNFGGASTGATTTTTGGATGFGASTTGGAAGGTSGGFNFGMGSSSFGGAGGFTGTGTTGGFTGTTGGFGFGGGGFAAGAPAGANQLNDVKLDTPYNKLPPNMKQAVDGLWKQISEQRELAARLKTVSDADLQALTADLRQLKQGLGKAQSIQRGLTVAAEVVNEDSKELLDATERHGAWPVARMLTPMAGVRVSEEMPSPHLWATIEHFKRMLRLYDAQIEALERQLSQTRGSGAREGDKAGGAVAPHTIAELMRVQQAAFMHVAGSVAALHETVDTLRARTRRRSDRDPFAAADRMEKDEKRKFANRMRGLAQPNANLPAAP
eukprot:CAMPEP_0118863862 /NCGR_PEP_ID=MMETSP1163-20130328/8592_1 /TAXON_ID=124430 /ORGANISM="Phaeomonas parva, Strain CCMP2877" /LENGTH=426 /DNA_ID=CAMNT_0006797913 /DNA_START=161 /DNA_END=1438 /DNA_ORIENTATION=+